MSTFARSKEPKLIKRVVDVAGAAFGLVLLAPVLAIISVWIRLDSPGPAIFKQRRVGKGGRPFTLYKFRSMQQDAEQVLIRRPELVQWDGPVFRVPFDDRITRAGRILRRLNLDEMPQLFNVLIGDMSLVGPRPHLVEEVERYEEWHHRRLSFRPGMTGSWQVADRHHISFSEWVAMDLEYLDSWSLRLDARILLRTGRLLFGTR